MLFLSALCNAQDTIRYPINEMKGIRLGVDASKFLLPVMYNGERSGFEVTADMHIKGNFFATAEAGRLKVNINWKNESDSITNYNYTGEGIYGKMGTDYNLLKSRRPFSNDIVYGGVRYAYSRFSHQANSIAVRGHFWPDGTRLSMPKTTMDTHWLELLLGVKAEVVNNFYVGLTFRFKFMIVSPKDDFSTPYIIPGYGNGNERFAIGINYYLSYNIHF